MNQNIIIAIDGYSSTGKSTLAKMLSKHFNYKHINTGSMYRAVTLHAIRNNWIDFSSRKNHNKKMIIESINYLKFDFIPDSNKVYEIYMNNESVENELKTPLVSEYVSIVSTYPIVRKKIVHLQQEIGKSKGVVMEGRDIGSVVFPDAELKLFITASSKIRAKRRHQELLKLGISSDLEGVLENLKMRDFLDSTRKDSPLKQVEDSILIDNTLMSIDDQFDFAVGLVEKKIQFL